MMHKEGSGAVTSISQQCPCRIEDHIVNVKGACQRQKLRQLNGEIQRQHRGKEIERPAAVRKIMRHEQPDRNEEQHIPEQIAEGEIKKQLPVGNGMSDELLCESPDRDQRAQMQVLPDRFQIRHGRIPVVEHARMIEDPLKEQQVQHCERIGDAESQQHALQDSPAGDAPAHRKRFCAASYS